MTLYILQLSFDVDQVTESLKFTFYDPDDVKVEELEVGPLAGTFNFNRGDEVLVRVIARKQVNSKAELRVPLNVNITNCTLVSIKPPSEQDLSLFDRFNACKTISEWTLPKETTLADTLEKRVMTEALAPLVVTANSGQWKISGYLSTLIEKDGLSVPLLYYFDPESSAGSGGGLGPPLVKT